MLASFARTLFLFGLLLALLGLGFQHAGVAEVFSDPLTHGRAQDESVYANSALGIATTGGWLTPKFMGRLMLFKPPLLVWMAALSLKLLGTSPFALRLPVLLVGASATLLLLYWSAKAHSLWTAAAAGLLLVADPAWHTFSRLCYTDMLVTAAVTAAIFTLWRDPQLMRWRSIIAFALSVSAGLMAKSVAGLMPIPVFLLFCAFTRRRPSSGFWKSLALIFLVSAPWHLYQAFVHRLWFWSDYVQTQLLGFGLEPPLRPEGAIPFYFKRLISTDPVLCLLVFTALPALLTAVRARKVEAAVLLFWLVLVAASLAAFQFRNFPYLLQLIPPLCLVASGYSPLLSAERRRIVVPVLGVLLCVKVMFGAPAWAISYAAPPPLPSAEALRWYGGLARSNELIAVNTDDEFSASVMPVRKIHYAFIDPTNVTLRAAPYYGYLGITLSVAEFDRLHDLEPVFRKRLLDWGLDSGEPIATAIVAKSAEEVVDMVSTHPRSDFYLPAGLRARTEGRFQTTHRLVLLASGRLFLLSLDSAQSKFRKPALE